MSQGYKFTKSEATEKALHEYREQLDSVYRFIHEFRIGGEHFVITKDRADQVSKNTFYTQYENWCNDDETDLTPVKKKNLNQRLEAMGLEVDPRGNTQTQRGVYTIRGLAWKNTNEEALSFERSVRYSGANVPPEFR